MRHYSRLFAITFLLALLLDDWFDELFDIPIADLFDFIDDDEDMVDIEEDDFIFRAFEPFYYYIIDIKLKVKKRILSFIIGT